MMQEDRSQHRNRAKAMAVLRTRLYDHERQKLDSARAADAPRPGRLGRPLRAHPHLQFPARPGERPPHQPHALQAAADHGRRSARRDHRRAGAPSIRPSCWRRRSVTPPLRGVDHRGGAARDRGTAFAMPEFDSPELDARMLVGHALGARSCGAGRRRRRRPLDEAAAAAHRAFAARASPASRSHASLAPGVLGAAAYGHARRLVPRPETETVVEARARARRSDGPRSRPLRVADLGIGSGAILLALLSELPNARGIGTDIAVDALDVARRNAERLGLAIARNSSRATRRGAARSVRPRRCRTLPISRAGTSRALARSARPRSTHALDGGADGLAAYRAIASDMTRLLGPPATWWSRSAPGNSTTSSSCSPRGTCNHGRPTRFVRCRPGRRGGPAAYVTLRRGSRPGGQKTAWNVAKDRLGSRSRN